MANKATALLALAAGGLALFTLTNDPSSTRTGLIYGLMALAAFVIYRRGI